GRYQLLSEIGKGGMGVVFCAYDPTISRQVAIKTILLTAVRDPSERRLLSQRLLREARAAGQLSHPNIVVIHDAGEDEGLAWIAMEYVAGNSLEQVLGASIPGGIGQL